MAQRGVAPWVGPPPPGYSIWLDAANELSITSVANAASQLNDLSANLWHVLQATGSKQPATGVSKIRGLNVLDGTEGAATSMQTSSAHSLAQPDTIYMVAQATGGSTGRMFDGFAEQNPRQLFDIQAAGTYRMYAVPTILTGGTTDTAVHQFTAYFNGASSQAWRDGVSIITGNPGSSAIGLILLFGSTYFTGHFCELLAYPGAPQTEVERYMRAKWCTSPGDPTRAAQRRRRR